jgi:hypothetical protein
MPVLNPEKAARLSCPSMFLRAHVKINLLVQTIKLRQRQWCISNTELLK